MTEFGVTSLTASNLPARFFTDAASETVGSRNAFRAAIQQFLKELPPATEVPIVDPAEVFQLFTYGPNEADLLARELQIILDAGFVPVSMRGPMRFQFEAFPRFKDARADPHAGRLALLFELAYLAGPVSEAPDLAAQLLAAGPYWHVLFQRPESFIASGFGNGAPLNN